MKKYEVVKAPTTIRRSFKITVGLREGYSPDGFTHARSEAVNALSRWMCGRVKENQPFLSGTVTTGEVVYAYRNTNGRAASESEPVVVFEGEVSVLYNAELADTEVMVILFEAAAALGDYLGQTRVYVTYCDLTWVLQAKEEETPTGETV